MLTHLETSEGSRIGSSDEGEDGEIDIRDVLKRAQQATVEFIVYAAYEDTSGGDAPTMPPAPVWRRNERCDIHLRMAGAWHPKDRRDAGIAAVFGACSFEARVEVVRDLQLPASSMQEPPVLKRQWVIQSQDFLH